MGWTETRASDALLFPVLINSLVVSEAALLFINTVREQSTDFYPCLSLGLCPQGSSNCTLSYRYLYLLRSDNEETKPKALHEDMYMNPLSGKSIANAIKNMVSAAL